MQCREIAVSISCHHHEHREEDEVVERSSSRVVAPQKPDGRPSPDTRVDEHEDDPVSEACSPYSRARRNQDGEALDAAEV